MGCAFACNYFGVFTETSTPQTPLESYGVYTSRLDFISRSESPCLVSLNLEETSRARAAKSPLKRGTLNSRIRSEQAAWCATLSGNPNSTRIRFLRGFGGFRYTHQLKRTCVYTVAFLRGGLGWGKDLR